MKAIPNVIRVMIGVVAFVAGLWLFATGVFGLIEAIKSGAQNSLLEYGTSILILIFGVGVVVKAVGILLSTRRKS